MKAAGPFRYVAAASTHAIVLAYAIGNVPARTWHADSAILDWDHAPDELRNAFEHGATFAAWNASFDTAVWNYATLGFPFLTPERIIDPMVQAASLTCRLISKALPATSAAPANKRMASG